MWSPSVWASASASSGGESMGDPNQTQLRIWPQSVALLGCLSCPTVYDTLHPGSRRYAGLARGLADYLVPRVRWTCQARDWYCLLCFSETMFAGQ